MFKRIKKLFKNDSSPVVSDENAEISAQEKEVSVFGEKRLQRQKLFEKWVVKEKWHLKHEGILLLLAIDPEYSNQRINEPEINELWLHAVDCVNNKLLTVFNPESAEDEWLVSPTNLYCWAKISRVSVPDELISLMDFVMQTILPVQETVEVKQQNNESNDNDAKYQTQREQILGAALSLLVNSPDSCKSKSGKISHRKIAKQILVQAKHWLGEEELLLSESAIQDLIEQHIQKGQNLHATN